MMFHLFIEILPLFLWIFNCSAAGVTSVERSSQPSGSATTAFFRCSRSCRHADKGSSRSNLGALGAWHCQKDRFKTPLVICYSSLLKMAIEIVEKTCQNGDVPSFFCVFTRGYTMYSESEGPQLTTGPAPLDISAALGRQPSKPCGGFNSDIHFLSHCWIGKPSSPISRNMIHNHKQADMATNTTVSVYLLDLLYW